MCKQYGKTPSELMHITEEYDAFCLDEAVAYILMKIEAGENPAYKRKCEKRTAGAKSMKELFGGQTKVQRRK